MILSKTTFRSNKKLFLKKIRAGAVFIYPTDTIYGIGCLASKKKSVEKIRRIKNRDSRPFSVIAPSKKWIRQNCLIENKDKKFLTKLPGKYTLIMNLKNKKLSPNPAIKTIGVRIPKSWFSKFVKELGEPVITTSVNLAGHSPMTSLQDLDKKIKESIDFIIYQGALRNKPSKIFNLTTNERIR